MNPDTLAVVVGTAAADSAAVAAMRELIVGIFPWLAPSVLTWAATALASTPIVPAILAWEFVGKKLREWSPAIGAKFAWLESWSWLINPILGAIIGQVWLGNSALGLVAGGLWGLAKKIPTKLVTEGGKMVTKSTVDGLTKAKRFSWVLAFGVLAASSSAQAQTATPEIERIPWTSSTRFGLGCGLHENWYGERGLVFGDARPKTQFFARGTYAVGDRLVIQLESGRALGRGQRDWQHRASLAVIVF